jgi:DnaJ-class molecular chaperone
MIPCSLFKNFVIRDCPKCKGTGRVRVWTIRAVLHRNYATKECPKCGGRGRVRVWIGILRVIRRMFQKDG